MKIKFFNSKKKNEIELNTYSLNKDFEEAKKDSDFISYNRFISTVLFKSDIGFESEVYKKFKSQYEMAIEKKFSISFDKFNIIFTLDKLTNELLVPAISSVPNATKDFINFKTPQQLTTNSIFYSNLNKEIIILINQKFKIEIFPNMILIFSPFSNTFKLIFNYKLINKASL
ncbi:MSC_0623 family F1-like ATPase-associated protein [[Mycoplasma] collis]|uniref:MSC_0623 family F1-like ATPase-associated protein n=1 Tax=[Mycoplasma] collis TaxID=2127 RepID=UPI00051C72B3|nr:DUF2714 domain-containing protein [[Mycoplasma] collis]